MVNNLSSTLLVVEDEDNDVFFLERTIRKAGVNNPVQVVRNGQQAMDYLAGNGAFADRERFPLPCLVFLDLHLPGKSGLEVLTWIRKQAELEAVIVVLLTASKEEAAISTAYEIGANSYLVKPATTDSLIVLLKALDLYSHDLEADRPSS
jgi:DNA-binding response OmpR family regulator